MVLVHFIKQMVDYIRDNGEMGKWMVKVPYIIILIQLHMRVNGKMISYMERELNIIKKLFNYKNYLIIGISMNYQIIGLNMMGNLLMIINMDLVYCVYLMEINILENSKMIKYMEKEFMLRRMPLKLMLNGIRIYSSVYFEC